MYCDHCDAPRASACARCHATVSPSANFCAQCGFDLRALRGADDAAAGKAQPAATAERRQLTVMFYDIAESTALVGRLGAEEVRRLIGRCHRVITEAIHRHRGFIVRYLGDGGLILFGHPHAYDDDVPRAAACALSIIDAITALEPSPQGERLQIRVALATGLVIVASDVGQGITPDQDVSGEAINLAARLQALTAPNTVVISAITRKVLGNRFISTDLGLKTLKGFEAPVQAWRLDAVAPSEMPTGQEAPLPLVDRNAELTLLERAWGNARDGAGQVVVITGEPGMGKSRLARHLVELARAGGNTVLRYFCSPHHEMVPLHPCIGQIERACNIQARDTAAVRMAKLEQAMTAYGHGANDVPLMANLLGLTPGDMHMAPQKVKERTIAMFLRQLNELSARGALLVVFEDAHWADPSSSELLDVVVGHIRTLPILLAVTSRNDKFQAWAGFAHFTAVALHPLCAEAQARLIRHIAGGVILPPDMLGDIIARADGVPLFAEELAKHLLEAQKGEPGAPPTAAKSGTTAHALPDTLHASLIARLDRLGEAKRVAQVAAALGRHFHHHHLEAVLDWEPARVQASIDKLRQAGLIVPASDGTAKAYTFKHALIQDTAYDSLLIADRRILHGAIADTLEKLRDAGAEPEPAMFARHCSAAARYPCAVEYYCKGGLQALGRFAVQEAIAQLGCALETLAFLEASPERDRREVEIVLLLAKAHIAASGHADAVTGTYFLRARRLCDAMGHPPELLSVLHGQWAHALMRGNPRGARERADELLAHDASGADPVWGVMRCRLAGVSCFPLGEFEESRALLERGLAQFDAQERATFSQVTLDDTEAVMSYYLAWSLLYLGHIDRAQAMARSAVELARALGQPYTLTQALCGSGYLATRLGDYELAQAQLLEVSHLCDAHGIPYFAVVAQILRGYCMAKSGDVAGLPQAQAGLAAYRASGSQLYVPSFLAMTAEIAADFPESATGGAEAALSLIEEAGALAARTDNRQDEAEILRLKGKYLIASGREREGRAALREAIATAHRQGALLWETKAALTAHEHAPEDADIRRVLADCRKRISGGSLWSVWRRADEALGPASTDEDRKATVG